MKLAEFGQELRVNFSDEEFHRIEERLHGVARLGNENGFTLHVHYGLGVVMLSPNGYFWHLQPDVAVASFPRVVCVGKDESRIEDCVRDDEGITSLPQFTNPPVNVSKMFQAILDRESRSTGHTS